jgi:hypothetical protein
MLSFSIRHVRSGIEDLAFPSRSSRESGRAGLRGRIRLNASKTRWFFPSESKPTRFPASLSSSRNHARSASKRFFPASSLILMKNVRSYAGAEKGDEGMALKIRTKAEDMPDGEERHCKLSPHKMEKHLED